MGLTENIFRMIQDTIEDLGVDFYYNKDEACFYSVPVKLQTEGNVHFPVMVLSFQVMREGFYCQVYCSEHLSDRSNEKETLCFMGYLNQYLATPGTQWAAFMNGAISCRRYVDCINTMDAPPSSDKIRANLYECMRNYLALIDAVVLVDLKKASAQDMFSALLA